MSASVSVEVPPRADRRRALLVAYASIALVATVIAAAVALDGATSDPALVATARALIVGVPLGVGLYAWYAREEERFGVLLILAGGGWFLTTLAESRGELPYTLGRAAGWLMELALVYLILAYPSGRLPGRSDRLIVLAMAIASSRCTCRGWCWPRASRCRARTRAVCRPAPRTPSSPSTGNRRS